MFGFGTVCGDGVGGLAEALIDVEYEEKMPPACLSQAHGGGGRTNCWDGEDSERQVMVPMVLCGHITFGCLFNTRVHVKACPVDKCITC